LLLGGMCFAQTDTIPARGTIKIGKEKPGEIYIKAIASFGEYDDSKVREVQSKYFQPFPVVEGYAYPFNYTKYFRDRFKEKEIDLKGKSMDTVVLQLTILANGKVYVKDKSKTMLIKNTPVTYDEKRGQYEINNLHMHCINFMKDIKQWFPGYVEFPKKAKFKRQTVIKPEKKNVDCYGSVMIIFSTTAFD
jgi:hypothetical protein